MVWVGGDLELIQSMGRDTPTVPGSSNPALDNPRDTGAATAARGGWESRGTVAGGVFGTGVDYLCMF